MLRRGAVMTVLENSDADRPGFWTPMPFPGDHADLLANFWSHTWPAGVTDYARPLADSVRCDCCGSKDRHVAATWPCGTDPDTVRCKS